VKAKSQSSAPCRPQTKNLGSGTTCASRWKQVGNNPKPFAAPVLWFVLDSYWKWSRFTQSSYQYRKQNNHSQIAWIVSKRATTVLASWAFVVRSRWLCTRSAHHPQIDDFKIDDFEIMKIRKYFIILNSLELIFMWWDRRDAAERWSSIYQWTCIRYFVNADNNLGRYGYVDKKLSTYPDNNTYKIRKIIKNIV